MATPAAEARYRIVDFAQLPPVSCPCGTARRAFADVPDFPGTVHQTRITTDARVHYHLRLTEVYYILECAPDAQMELDGQRIGIGVGQCVLIPPGVRHRAIGEMTVLVIVYPRFDPQDEWFDDSHPGAVDCVQTPTQASGLTEH